MKLTLIPSILFCGMIALSALDVKTKSGKEYKDVEINRISSSGITIMHEGGSATVPLNDLSDEFIAALTKAQRAQLEKVVLRLMKDSEEQEKKFQVQKENESLKDVMYVFKSVSDLPVISQIVDDGILVYASEFGREPVFITDIPLIGLVDGSPVPWNMNPGGHSLIIQVSGDNQIVHCRWCKLGFYIKKNGNATAEANQSKCNEKVLCLYRTGTYSYMTVNNVKKTIAKYTYSRENALKYWKVLENSKSSGKTKTPEIDPVPSF